MHGAAVQQLATALKNCSFADAQPWELGAAVDLIVDEIDRNPAIQARQAECAARTLIKHRYYSHARTVAQRWTEARDFDPLISKHLAQALINIAALDNAESVLNNGLPKLRLTTGDANALRQIPEYEGLLGRVFKQRFIVTGDLNWLVRSRERYLETFLREPQQYWIGINATALRAREEREGLPSAGLPSSLELASKVLEIARQRYTAASVDGWSAATASEASLALNDYDGAEFWLLDLTRFHGHVTVSM